ncbi:MAG: MJ0042-type zinc finger domain-containing protein, partial [Steroidobacteraceae bacterium]
MPRALMSPGSPSARSGSAFAGGAADGLSPARFSMFTVCPKCALTLVVTAADLRVAQGYVRCGRCSSVFNALAQLT